MQKDHMKLNLLLCYQSKLALGLTNYVLGLFDINRKGNTLVRRCEQ